MLQNGFSNTQKHCKKLFVILKKKKKHCENIFLVSNNIEICSIRHNVAKALRQFFKMLQNAVFVVVKTRIFQVLHDVDIINQNKIK